MRTTIDIADDVLRAAKELARREQKTAGEMVSELLRLALTVGSEPTAAPDAPTVHGLRPFARRGHIVTNELIDQLRGDDAY